MQFHKLFNSTNFERKMWTIKIQIQDLPKIFVYIVKLELSIETFAFISYVNGQ